MATLFKQPGSDNWWIRYSIGGKQVRKSTGTDDEGKAQLQLREVELVLVQRAETGTVSQKLARAIESETIRPIAVEVILESRRKHVAERTRELYLSRDKRFVDWLRHNFPHATNASQLDRNMLRSFLDHVADRFNARTHNGYLRRLRSVFRSAVRDGFALQDPTVGIPTLPESPSVRRPFTETELRDLFVSLSGHVRLLATIGLYAGAMRLSDIVCLTWSNVDFQNRVIRWRMSKRRGKHMEIAIHPRLLDELQSAYELRSTELPTTHGTLSPHIDARVKSLGGPVFPTFYKSHHRASEAFRKALVRASLRKDNRSDINRRYVKRRREKRQAAKTGAEYTPEQPVRLHKSEIDFHSLRYNFVSILKQQGCPEAIARSIMGHSSVEVNAIYTHIDADSERKWVSSLPNVLDRSNPPADVIQQSPDRAVR